MTRVLSMGVQTKGQVGWAEKGRRGVGWEGSTSGSEYEARSDIQYLHPQLLRSFTMDGVIFLPKKWYHHTSLCPILNTRLSIIKIGV